MYSAKLRNRNDCVFKRTFSRRVANSGSGEAYKAAMVCDGVIGSAVFAGQNARDQLCPSR